MTVGLALSCVRRVIQNVNMRLWLNATAVYATARNQSLHDSVHRQSSRRSRRASIHLTWVGVKAIGESRGGFPLLFLVLENKMNHDVLNFRRIATALPRLSHHISKFPKSFSRVCYMLEYCFTCILLTVIKFRPMQSNYKWLKKRGGGIGIF